MRTWAARVGGGRARSARDLSGGFSPGATAVLDCPGGAIFVKAVGAELTPSRPSSTDARRWCRRALPPAPSSRGCSTSTTTATGWRWPSRRSTGGPPVHPWDRRELRPRCARSTPCTTPSRPSPVPASPAAGRVRLRHLFGGWAELAALDRAPEGLDEWSAPSPGPPGRARVGLAGRGGGVDAAARRRALRQPARDDGGVVFVDWPHACVGAPAFDLVAWAPSVTLEGGPAPEELLALSVTGVGGRPRRCRRPGGRVQWLPGAHSLQPPPPGLPTLRAVPGRAGCGGAGLAPAPHGLVSPGRRRDRHR